MSGGVETYARKLVGRGYGAAAEKLDEQGRYLIPADIVMGYGDTPESAIADALANRRRLGR